MDLRPLGCFILFAMLWGAAFSYVAAFLVFAIINWFITAVGGDIQIPITLTSLTLGAGLVWIIGAVVSD